MSFDPFISMYLILLIGAVYSFVVRYGVYELIGMKKVQQESKDFHKDMGKINKKYMSAIKKGKPDEAVKLESEVNAMFKKLLFLQLKMFIFMIPIIFMYRWVVGFVVDNFSYFVIQFPFKLPTPHLGGPEWIVWRDSFGPRGWFWMTFLLLSMLAARKLNKNNLPNDKDNVKEVK